MHRRFENELLPLGDPPPKFPIGIVNEASDSGLFELAADWNARCSGGKGRVGQAESRPTTTDEQMTENQMLIPLLFETNKPASKQSS